MLKTLAYATLFSTALVGSSAMGEDNPAVPKNQPAQVQPDQMAAAAIVARSGIDFVTMQEKAQWRAPKLIGVGVYGPDDKQIGKIDDILMGHAGASASRGHRHWRIPRDRKEGHSRSVLGDKWKTEPRKVGDRLPTNRSLHRWAARRAPADEGDGPRSHRSDPGLSRQSDPKCDPGAVEGCA